MRDYQQALNAITYKGLVQVLERLRSDGRIGFDVNRNEMTNSKAKLISHILTNGRGNWPANCRPPTLDELEAAITGLDVGNEQTPQHDLDLPEIAKAPEGQDDAKTYGEWMSEGRAVKKGEHATGRNEEGKATFKKSQTAELSKGKPSKAEQSKGKKAGEGEGESEAKGQQQQEGEGEGEGEGQQDDPLRKEIRKIADEQLDKRLPEFAEQIAEAMGERIAEIEANGPSRSIEIRTPDAPPTKLDEHTHPLFEKILRLAGAGLNIMLTGPAGCGKTHVAAQVARALNRDFASISLTSGASEAQLLGRYLPTGEAGRFEYTSAPFIDMYEGGGVFLLDEMDAADPNMLLIINSALSNKGFFNDLRRAKPYVERAGKSVVLGATNTFGTGADAMYTGRAQLDAATLDRWYVVQMHYDEQLERVLAGMPALKDAAWKPAAKDATSAELCALGEWVLALRKKCEAARLRRVVSTRAIQKAMAASKAGIPVPEVKRDILAGWTKDELSKVGEAA